MYESCEAARPRLGQAMPEPPIGWRLELELELDAALAVGCVLARYGYGYCMGMDMDMNPDLDLDQEAVKRTIRTINGRASGRAGVIQDGVGPVETCKSEARSLIQQTSASRCLLPAEHGPPKTTRRQGGGIDGAHNLAFARQLDKS